MKLIIMQPVEIILTCDQRQPRRRHGGHVQGSLADDMQTTCRRHAGHVQIVIRAAVLV